jgi:calmodulin
MENDMTLLDEDMLNAFKSFDKNGDGFISPEELKIAMKNLGENLSAKDIQVFFSNFF